MEKDKRASRKYEFLGFERDPTKAKAKEVKQVEHDPIKELTQLIKDMKIEHAREMNFMQARLIQMERSQAQNIQPRNNNNRGNNNTWPKKNPLNEQRPPNPLESTNIVEQPMPFCRPCESFHEESSCAFAKRIIDEGTSEQINIISQEFDSSSEGEDCCTEIIPSSFTINNFSDEKDPITQIYGERPS